MRRGDRIVSLAAAGAFIVAGCSASVPTVEVEENCKDYVAALKAYSGTMSRYFDSTETLWEDVRAGHPMAESLASHIGRQMDQGATAEDVQVTRDLVWRTDWTCSWVND